MRKFPIVQAKGSHYEVGVAIGKTMNGAIKRVLSKAELFSRKIFQFVCNDQNYFRNTQKYFPQYIDELGDCEGQKSRLTSCFFLTTAK